MRRRCISRRACSWCRRSSVREIKAHRCIETRARSGVPHAGSPASLDGGTIEARIAAAAAHGHGSRPPISIHDEPENHHAMLPCLTRFRRIRCRGPDDVSGLRAFADTRAASRRARGRARTAGGSRGRGRSLRRRTPRRLRSCLRRRRRRARGTRRRRGLGRFGNHHPGLLLRRLRRRDRHWLRRRNSRSITRRSSRCGVCLTSRSN